MGRRFNPVPGSGEVFTTPPSFSAGNYFGFDLGYDRNGIIGSYVPQYNGNIGGMAWKSAHDGQVRKYDFAYDAVNRLTGADFNQYTGNGFNKACGVDFSVGGLDYDANGNIGHMNQMGLVNNTVKWVDQLAYTYLPNSNRLAKVADAAPNNAVAKLGDFQDGANSGDDYGYDNGNLNGNGNMTKDFNKGISKITYNVLNLPQQVDVTGKGSIVYTYDATGNKLAKTTTDNLSGNTITTTYAGGIVYQNDVLQFIGMGEGRIRLNTSLTGFNFDYFLKDHLGNTRMTLTDDPAASSPILDATSYYPFGLAMAGISSKASGALENREKTFQGQRFDDDFGIDVYSFKYRNEDRQTGRFWQVDPLADEYEYNSTYAFSEDKVTTHVELEGLEAAYIFRGLWGNVKSEFVSLGSFFDNNLAHQSAVSVSIPVKVGSTTLPNNVVGAVTTTTTNLGPVMSQLINSNTTANNNEPLTKTDVKATVNLESKASIKTPLVSASVSQTTDKDGKTSTSATAGVTRTGVDISGTVTAGSDGTLKLGVSAGGTVGGTTVKATAAVSAGNAKPSVSVGGSVTQKVGTTTVTASSTLIFGQH